MDETLDDRIKDVMERIPSVPENNQPTKPVAKPIAEKPKRKIPKILIAVITPVFIVGVLFLALSPRLSVNKYLSGMENPISSTRSSLGQVDDSLSNILNLVTGNQESELKIISQLDLTEAANELRDVLDSDGKVAGLSVGPNLNIYDEFSERSKRIRAAMSNFTKKNFSEFGSYTSVEDTDPDSDTGEVQGTEDLEGPLISALREIKQTANHGQDGVSEARTNLELLRNSADSDYPTKLKSLYKKVDLAMTDTQNYLSEAKKTVDYYDMITGVSIELVPAVTSINVLIVDLASTTQPQLYLDKIEELLDTITDLTDIATDYPQSSVPKGLESLHADNITTLELIDKTVKGIKQSVITNDGELFADYVTKFGIDLEVVSTRAKVYELSFWQQSKLFKNHEALDEQFDEITNQISDLKGQNSVPFLN